MSSYDSESYQYAELDNHSDDEEYHGVEMPPTPATRSSPFTHYTNNQKVSQGTAGSGSEYAEGESEASDDVNDCVETQSRFYMGGESEERAYVGEVDSCEHSSDNGFGLISSNYSDNVNTSINCTSPNPHYVDPVLTIASSPTAKTAAAKHKSLTIMSHPNTANNSDDDSDFNLSETELIEPVPILDLSTHNDVIREQYATATAHCLQKKFKVTEAQLVKALAQINVAFPNNSFAELETVEKVVLARAGVPARLAEWIVNHRVAECRECNSGQWQVDQGVPNGRLVGRSVWTVTKSVDLSERSILRLATIINDFRTEMIATPPVCCALANEAVAEAFCSRTGHSYSLIQSICGRLVNEDTFHQFQKVQTIDVLSGFKALLGVSEDVVRETWDQLCNGTHPSVSGTIKGTVGSTTSRGMETSRILDSSRGSGNHVSIAECKDRMKRIQYLDGIESMAPEHFLSEYCFLPVGMFHVLSFFATAGSNLTRRDLPSDNNGDMFGSSSSPRTEGPIASAMQMLSKKSSYSDTLAKYYTPIPIDEFIHAACDRHGFRCEIDPIIQTLKEHWLFDANSLREHQWVMDETMPSAIQKTVTAALYDPTLLSLTHTLTGTISHSTQPNKAVMDLVKVIVDIRQNWHTESSSMNWFVRSPQFNVHHIAQLLVRRSNLFNARTSPSFRIAAGAAGGELSMSSRDSLSLAGSFTQRFTKEALNPLTEAQMPLCRSYIRLFEHLLLSAEDPHKRLIRKSNTNVKAVLTMPHGRELFQMIGYEEYIDVMLLPVLDIELIQLVHVAFVDIAAGKDIEWIRS